MSSLFVAYNLLQANHFAHILLSSNEQIGKQHLQKNRAYWGKHGLRKKTSNISLINYHGICICQRVFASMSVIACLIEYLSCLPV